MNLAVVLFLLTVVTGLAWFADLLWFRPARRRRALTAEAQWMLSAQASGATLDESERRRMRDNVTRRPAWLEYTAGLFPVFVAVFFLRSFLFEPFRIPSGSMIPTLLIGDMILVNKFSYGVRLPIVHTKLFDVGSPQRGDVMVFRYPLDPRVDYVKRVVGLPGDAIELRRGRISINGKEVPLEAAGVYTSPDVPSGTRQYLEKLGEVEHKMLTDIGNPSFITMAPDAVHSDACHPSVGGITCLVPKGHYFMMGDNRDSSSDSRVWGFVPDENIVGRAFLIWMNFSDFSRIGSFK